MTRADYPRCATCGHWTRVEGPVEWDPLRVQTGDCEHERFVYTGDCATPPEKDVLLYWDFESYCGGFRTGEQFGCLHHTALDAPEEGPHGA